MDHHSPLPSTYHSRMSAEDQYPVNYACTSDDARFIRSPDRANARRIGWISWIMRGYWGVGRDEALLELLEGKEEDVWLWKDGDEGALPEPPGRNDESLYVLAGKALQTRKASRRSENREMAEMRQRVQSEIPAVRLAAIAWLALTSKAMKKRDSEHGRMDREEWDLLGLINEWWLDVYYGVRIQLLEASPEEFVKAMKKEGHTCHTEHFNPFRLCRWLYVQSVLFPERAGAAVNLMYRDDDDKINCRACWNQWVFPYLEAMLTHLSASTNITTTARRSLTNLPHTLLFWHLFILPGSPQNPLSSNGLQHCRFIPNTKS